MVYGLGHPDRGDDAVGPQVADRVAGHLAGRRRVRVGSGSEPLGLIDLLVAGAAVVVVDAVRTGAPAGTVLVRDLDRDPLPDTGAPGSGHLLGLDQVLGLARSTGRLTRPAWLVGVEATGFDYGAGLAPAVEAAVPLAAGTVLDLALRVADG